MPQVQRAKDEPWPLPFLRSQREALEPKLREALAAYDSLRSAPASAESLGPIVRAALDPRVEVHEHGTQLLAHLTGEHEAALTAVAKMAEQPGWRYRVSALACLGPATPKEFAVKLVGALLEDSTSRVRAKAAEQALQLNLTSLTEAVSAASANEASATAIHAFELSRDLMQDGYAMKPGNGGFWITVWTGNGATGSWYSDEDVASRGLDAILADLRATAAPDA
jgi:hypothetical protein